MSSEGPRGVVYEVEESTVVSEVHFKLRAFRLWNPATDQGDRAMDGVVETEMVIEGERADTTAFGNRTVVYDVPGQILMSDGLLLWNQNTVLRDWVIAAGEVIIDRRGWGAQKGELEVLSTTPGKVGEYLDLEIPHQVNAKLLQSPIAQRGGERRVQIIGRTAGAGADMIHWEDAGNVAQDPPDEPDEDDDDDPNTDVPVPDLSLAASVDDPLTIATTTVDNAADITALNGDVWLEYAEQELEPTDAGTAWGPVRTSVGTDTLDMPPIASGGTIWVRGQTRIAATSQLSDWSAWVSITLGPDDDGTGGVLPPIDLVLTIDADGVVSASASGVAAITKVYFDAGTPNGAAPTYAETLAGATDTSAPFTAASIITLTEGQAVTVAAIGEDALGNRTILVTESITYTVDTGSGAGTPGDAFITYYSGPPVEITPGVAVTEHDELRVGRFFYNTSNVQAAALQVGVGPDGPTDSKLALQYSKNTGVTWRFCDDGQTGPFTLLDAEKYPSPGGALACDDDDFAGENRLIRVVSVDGDGTTPVEVGNIYIRFTRSATPPETEEPDPGIPTEGLIANWELTEGGGSSVASKAPVPSGPTLILGFTTGVESDARFDPSWQTGPRRLRPAGFDLVYSAFSHIANIPSYAAGSACFMYIDITTLGGLPKYVMGTGNSPYPYRMGIDASNKLFVQITEDSGGDPVRTATGTTSITNGFKGLVGFRHRAASNLLEVFVNPADGEPEGSTACATAKFDATTDLIIGGGSYPPGANQPDNFDHGDVNYHVGATLPSNGAIAELYALRKLVYTDLP